MVDVTTKFANGYAGFCVLRFCFHSHFFTAPVSVSSNWVMYMSMGYIHQMVSIPFAWIHSCYRSCLNKLSYVLSISAIKSWISWTSNLSLSLSDEQTGRHNWRQQPSSRRGRRLKIVCRVVALVFPVDLIHKSQNASVPYPTMLHSEQNCAHFCSEWDTVRIWNRCILRFVKLVYQVEGRSWIYVQHVNLASFGGRPVNLRATRKFTANNGAFCWRILANV